MRDFEALANFIADMLFVIDMEGNIVFANSRAINTLGYSRDELCLLSIDGIDTKVRMREYRAFWLELEPGQSRTIESMHRSKSGKLIPVEIHSTLMEDAGERFVVSIARDISEIRKSKIEIRNQNILMKQALRLAKMGAWKWDVKPGLWTFSDEWCDIHGVKRGTLSTDKLTNIAYPEDIPQIEKAFEEAKKGIPYDIVHRIVRQDTGELRYIHAVGVAEFSEELEVVCVQGFAQDITEQKLLEEELGRSEENFRKFFNSIDDFVFILDNRGSILEFNEAVTKRLGYSSAELIGEPVLEVHPENRRDEASRIVKDTLAGKCNHCPIPLVSKTGEVIPVETSITKGFWDGNPVLFGISKDVSALKRSEERFSKAFHSSPLIIGLTDLETGEYVEVNQKFCEVSGFSREEIIGRRSTEILMIDADYREKIISRLKSSGAIRDEETILFGKDGRKIHVLLSVNIIDIAGKPYVFTTAIDISSLKETEEKLRESEKGFRMLVENTHDIIFTTNGTGDFRYVSLAWERLLGHNLEDVVGHSYREFIHPDDIQTVDNALSKAFIENRSQNLPSVEYRARHTDGTWKWFSANGYATRDNEDGPRYFTGVAREITGEKEALEALRSSEEEMSLILNTTNESIIYYDTEQRVIWANRAVVERIGLEERDIEGKRCFDIWGYGDKCDNCVLARAISSSKPQEQEIAHGLEEIWLVRAYPVFGSNGAVSGVVEISQNITEKKQSSKKLEAAFNALVRAASDIVSAKDPYTAGHQRNVSDLAVAIGKEMGLDQETCDCLRVSGLLHDIGKISIPTEILTRPGKLTAIEFNLIKEHSKNGYNILKEIDLPWPVADIVLQHHERLDGSGYPGGLKGDVIRLESKIIAVADVVEAMASHRPYREALGLETAIDEIIKESGRLYDPTVVEACVKVLEDGYSLTDQP